MSVKLEVMRIERNGVGLAAD